MDGKMVFYTRFNYKRNSKVENEPLDLAEELGKRLDSIEVQLSHMKVMLFHFTKGNYNPFVNTTEVFQNIEQKIENKVPSRNFLQEMIEQDNKLITDKALQKAMPRLSENKFDAKEVIQKKNIDIPKSNQFFKELGPDVKVRRVSTAPSGQEFNFHNGKQVKDLNELFLHLKQSSPDEFHIHVDTNKNDFAQWVANVLKEDELANTLRNKSNREEFLETVENHIK